MPDHTELGRHVAEDGRIVYAWPPEGRFAALWCRIEAALPYDDDKCEAAVLLERWRDETGTLVGYMDVEDGVWHDVEPDWTVPTGWLGP